MFDNLPIIPHVSFMEDLVLLPPFLDINNEHNLENWIILSNRFGLNTQIAIRISQYAYRNTHY